MRMLRITALALAAALAAHPAQAKRRPAIEPFKVLTLNTAGIPLVHAQWPARRRAIIKALQQSNYAIVALQEVWLDGDAAEIAKASGMPYFARDNSKPWLGDGLLVLSRFPIMESHHITFSCEPPLVRKIYQGDSVAGKGALMVRLNTPGGELDVYTTHLVSDYLPADKYLTWRQSQIFELYEMMTSLSSHRPILLMGDLNTSPQDAEYNILGDLLDLQDVCLKRGYDQCGNSDDDELRRVDHILLPSGRRTMEFDSRLSFTDTLPGSNVSYSDHKGVEATLDGRIFSLHLDPNRARQVEILKDMHDRFARIAAVFWRRVAARNWIPVYGAVHELVNIPQIERLEAVKNRIESVLISQYRHY